MQFLIGLPLIITFCIWAGLSLWDQQKPQTVLPQVTHSISKNTIQKDSISLPQASTEMAVTSKKSENKTGVESKPEYDLNSLPKSASDINFFIKGNERPAQIIFNDGKEVHRVVALNQEKGKTYSKTLYIGSEESSDEVRIARLSPITPTPDPKKNSKQDSKDQKKDEKKSPQPLGTQEYELVRFEPGRTDRGKTIALPKNIFQSILGPDFSFDGVSQCENDCEEKIEDLRGRVVSLGHGGLIILKVKSQGWIQNLNGPDFYIYENVMRLPSGGLYQEFAKVGVSQTPEASDVIWFDCDPENNNLRGCAGVVPTLEGGDSFDLSDIGIDETKYIWIKDTGKNFNNLGKNTEGFDLDALRIEHGYRNYE